MCVWKKKEIIMTPTRSPTKSCTSKGCSKLNSTTTLVVAVDSAELSRSVAAQSLLTRLEQRVTRFLRTVQQLPPWRTQANITDPRRANSAPLIAWTLKLHTFIYTFFKEWLNARGRRARRSVSRGQPRVSWNASVTHWLKIVIVISKHW